jgi:hypothetical protein
VVVSPPLYLNLHFDVFFGLMFEFLCSCEFIYLLQYSINIANNFNALFYVLSLTYSYYLFVVTFCLVISMYFIFML